MLQNVEHIYMDVCDRAVIRGADIGLLGIVTLDKTLLWIGTL